MDVKSVAYMAIARPCLKFEYANVVWNPHTVFDINIIEAVHKRAAQWVCARLHFHGTNLMMINCLRELNWPTTATII